MNCAIYLYIDKNDFPIKRNNNGTIRKDNRSRKLLDVDPSSDFIHI